MGGVLLGGCGFVEEELEAGGVEVAAAEGDYGAGEVAERFQRVLRTGKGVLRTGD